MMVTSLTSVQAASVAAAVLIAGVAAFQVALALGVPLGAAVLGGKAPTRDGVLTGPFRVLAVVQAIVLLLLAAVLLARTGVVTIPGLGRDTLAWMTWVIVVFLLLNTVANSSAPHPVERWGMGSVTLVLAGLGLFIALGS
jgi:hypothetical protein